MSLKRLARVIGGTVVAVSLIFVAQQLWIHATDAGAWDVGTDLLLATIVGSVVYAGACLFLSSAWRRLLHIFSNIQIPALVAASLYARSQMGKYVPGNIFHFAVRHALGRDHGLAHSALVLSALGEIGGLTAAASTLGLLAATLTNIGEEYAFLHWAFTATIITTGIVILFLPRLWTLLRHRFPSIPEVNNEELRREVASAFVQYLLFFLFAGAVLVLLVTVTRGSIDLHSAAATLLVFALSWMAGFITPGAPSGIGVREAIIVISLDSLGLTGQSLAIALLFRISTVCGDVMFLLTFMHMNRREFIR